MRSVDGDARFNITVVGIMRHRQSAGVGTAIPLEKKFSAVWKDRTNTPCSVKHCTRLFSLIDHPYVSFLIDGDTTWIVKFSISVSVASNSVDDLSVDGGYEK